MTFLAPWALAIGAAGALGMVLLHLVAWQRPAAYVLPTTRFIPDQRTVVSRAATRPRDVLLLVLRVLMLLAAATAFARPVLTPSSGSMATIVLLDRSRAVADERDALAKARAALGTDGSSLLIAFDSTARVVGLDSLSREPASASTGSLSAALALARRTAADLAERVDSVRLVIVSPLMRRELDVATPDLRATWPGAVSIERVAARRDSSPGATVRMVYHALSADDSAAARSGATVVHWDSASASNAAPQGLSVGDEVVVAMFGRLQLQSGGHAVASWADGTPAAREITLGSGCIRDVGVSIPAAGDLVLHAPFQRAVRRLSAPCGAIAADVAMDSAIVRRVFGAPGAAAPSTALRNHDAPPTPIVKWLLAIALLLGFAELVVRTRLAPTGAS